MGEWLIEECGEAGWRYGGVWREWEDVIKEGFLNVSGNHERKESGGSADGLWRECRWTVEGV